MDAPRGATFNEATMIVNNSTLTYNSGVDGGGIINYSTLTVNGSLFADNSATEGGSIYNQPGGL